MEYITLRNSDLKVSRLCMGGCPMGGYGWGNVLEKELIDAVHAALDNGQYLILLIHMDWGKVKEHLERHWVTGVKMLL